MRLPALHGLCDPVTWPPASIPTLTSVLPLPSFSSITHTCRHQHLFFYHKSFTNTFLLLSTLSIMFCMLIGNVASIVDSLALSFVKARSPSLVWYLLWAQYRAVTWHPFTAWSVSIVAVKVTILIPCWWGGVLGAAALGQVTDGSCVCLAASHDWEVPSMRCHHCWHGR